MSKWKNKDGCWVVNGVVTDDCGEKSKSVVPEETEPTPRPRPTPKGGKAVVTPVPPSDYGKIPEWMKKKKK